MTAGVVPTPANRAKTNPVQSKSSLKAGAGLPLAVGVGRLAKKDETARVVVRCGCSVAVGA